MHPALGVDGFGCLGRIVPVAVHDRVAARTQLTALAWRNDDAGVGVNDLHLQMRLHLTHGGHTFGQRRGGAALAAHRAGFGHAVGDGDFRQVHVVHHPLHHGGGARRAGHDAGAQRGQIEFLESRVVQLGDEHGGHAVQAGAFFVLHRFQHGERVEAVIGVDDGGAMREAGQVAQHHAEAVVQRHGNAQAVGSGELHALADEEPVVQNVAVRQRGALGEAGGAAGELDVDRVGGLELGGGLGHARVVSVTACQQIGEAHQPRLVRALPGLIDPHHRVQVWQLLRFEQARLAVCPLGRQLAQHAQVVAGLEARHGHQQLAIDLVQRVFHLAGAVGRVDVHQNQTHLGGGQLHQQPLGVVVRPDRHPVARHQAQAQQGARQAAGLGLQFTVGQASPLMHAHQRLVIGLALDHVVKTGTDGLLDQRHIGGATGLALLQRGQMGFGHGRSPLRAVQTNTV